MRGPKPDRAGRAAFTVHLMIPEGVSRADMAEYILDAVCGWNGGFNPDDNPLTDLDRFRVSVQDKLRKISYRKNAGSMFHETIEEGEGVE